MQAVIPIFIVGVISGAVIGLQGPMASIISHKLGLKSVYCSSGRCCDCSCPAVSNSKGGNLAQWRNLLWYVLLAGVFTLVVFAAISYLIPQVDIAPAMMSIILGQVVIGAILEHYGILGVTVRHFPMSKLTGMTIMLAGDWLAIRS